MNAVPQPGPACGGVGSLDTARCSLLHIGTAAPPYATNRSFVSTWVVPCLVVGAIAFGSIVFLVIATRGARFLLQAKFAWLTACQFVLVFPLLLVTLRHDRFRLPAAVNALTRRGLLRYTQDREELLCRVWAHTYGAINLLAQFLGGISVAAGVVVLNYTVHADPSQFIEEPLWYVDKAGITPAGYLWLAWLGIFWWVVIVYVVRLFAAAFFLRDAVTKAKIDFLFHDPDSFNGFAPVGMFSVPNQFLVAAAGLSVIVLLTTTRYYQEMPTTNYYLFGGAIALYLVCAPAAFFGPLYPFHKEIAAERQRQLGECRARVATLKQRIIPEGGAEALAQQNAELSEWEKKKQIIKGIPTWPFDHVSVVWRFWAAYAFPLFCAIIPVLLERAVPLESAGK